MGRVNGKVVVVTGGSKGIGKAACLRAAQQGAIVAVTDIEDDKGKQVAEDIKSSGGQAAYYHMNVADEDQVQATFSKVKEEFGPITGLVNNAGISGADRPVNELSEDDWQQVLDVNVKGVFFCTKHAIPQMQEAGSGSIVNLSSIYGIIGAPDIPPYHASKGAVRLMSKTDALTYAKQGIRVNSVHPGYIVTPLVKELAERRGQSWDEFKQELDAAHPVGHPGEPDDIAHGIVYLLSDEAKFVTGSELVIDGGYTAR